VMLQGVSDDLDILLARLNGGHPVTESTNKLSQNEGALQHGNSTALEEKGISIGAANCDKVRMQTKKVFRKELSQTLTGAINRVFSDYIVRPYQQVCDEYTERSQMEQHLFFERVDMVIKTSAGPSADQSNLLTLLRHKIW